MDPFICDFGLENADGPDMLLDFNDVLYRDVDLSTLSCLSPTEDDCKFGGSMPPLKSPWSDSDSGISDIQSDYNDSSPTAISRSIVKFELEEQNNPRVNQHWCLENNNNSSDFTPKRSLGVENQYQQLKEKQLDISNYINSVNSTAEENLNKVSKLNACVMGSNVRNLTSTIRPTSSDLSLENTPNSNSFYCPEKENKLHNTSLVPSKPRTVSPCQNILNDVDKSRKNALQAKLNREKKKSYMKGLEEEVETLKQQNRELKSDNDTFKLKTAELEEEVEYLKSVLVNSSALSALLKNIGHTNGVKLSSTITNRKRKLESATDSSTYEVEHRLKNVSLR